MNPLLIMDTFFIITKFLNDNDLVNLLSTCKTILTWLGKANI